MAIITLTTDFGTADGYVGAMKGVIAREGDAVVVDIAHDIPPGDIAHAAWVLATAAPQFPVGTIHVVVVDPGVGGARQSVIVKSRGMWFVGPDNGVFGYVTDEHTEAWAIDTSGRRISSTFHGRDVFAYAAARLDVTVTGAPVRLAGRLPWGDRERGEGRIVHIDRFGNLISDLTRGEAGPAIVIAGHRMPVLRTYVDVPPGELLAYIGSSGTIEIAVRDGRADRRLNIARGEPVLPAGDAGPFR